MPPRMRSRAASMSAIVTIDTFTLWRSRRRASVRQRDAGLHFREHAAERFLDPFERLRVVGLEAQHDHRRRVRRAREAEAVRILDAQTIDADDVVGTGEIRDFGKPLDQRMLLAFGARDLQ